MDAFKCLGPKNGCPADSSALWAGAAVRLSLANGATRQLREMVLVLGILFSLSMSTMVFGEQEVFAPESTLKVESGQIVPAQWLKSEHHRVASEATCDGYVYEFLIETRWGQWEASGLQELEVRIHEAQAMAALEEMEKTEEFQKAVQAALTGPYRTVKSVVQRPVATARGLGSGVKRLLQRTALEAQETAHKINQAQEEVRKVFNPTPQDNPPKNSEGPGTNPIGARRLDGDKVLDKGEGWIKDLIGYDKAKRRVARELNVDPNTENGDLRRELEEIAWVVVAGGLAFRQIDLPVPELVNRLGQVHELVWQQHPKDLERQNRQWLGEMGVERDSLDRLFWETSLSPTTETRITRALVELEGVTGRASAIEVVLQSERFRAGKVIARSLEMLVRYHEGVDRLARLADGPLLPWGFSESGTWVVAVPAECLLWTEEFVQALSAAESAMALKHSAEKRLILEGPASAKAREGLKSHGWLVVVDRRRGETAD